MRKYLLGITAVVLALSLSAFSKVNVNHPKKGFTSYQFVHTAHDQSNTASDWTYTATPGACTASTNYCKAFFTETSQPQEGANPTNINSETGRQTGDY